MFITNTRKINGCLWIFGMDTVAVWQLTWKICVSPRLSCFDDTEDWPRAQWAISPAFFWRQYLTKLLNFPVWVWTCDPSVSVSQRAEIKGICNHAQLWAEVSKTCLPREKYLLPHIHALFISSLFGSMYVYGYNYFQEWSTQGLRI